MDQVKEAWGSLSPAWRVGDAKGLGVYGVLGFRCRVWGSGFRV